jgi:hypothetical protein
MAHNRPQMLIRPDVAVGSFATELIKADGFVCPLYTQ